MTGPLIESVDTKTASDFWKLLSPETPLFSVPSTLLYRGQANHLWSLTPGILRDNDHYQRGSDNQVFKEWAYLADFVRSCDSIGLPVPNDSLAFREAFLSQNTPSGPGEAFRIPAQWPPPALYELLALGQHYGLSTRLLDWSTRSYVAAYFAASDALKLLKAGVPIDHLAVWVLNVECKSSLPKLEVLKVPGSNNVNIAAQAGCFTLLKQDGYRGSTFQGDTAVDLYIEKVCPDVLKKVTLPISEASEVLHLCSLYGVTGCTLFPGYSGAIRAINDRINMESKLPL